MELETQPADTRRLFIAIDLPPHVRKQLADVLKRLQTGCRFVDCHPKWVMSDNLHVTLVFLGNVEKRDIPDVSGILTEVAGRVSRFELALDGLGFFPPDVRDPKVLSTGISGDVKALTGLYEKVAGALKEKGISIQERPYRPHLTLARVTSIKTSSRLAPLAESHRTMLNAKFPVNEIVLFESRLGANGATYEQIAVAPLSQPADEI